MHALPIWTVMYLIRNMEIGGAQVIVNQLVNGLPRDRYRVVLCVMTREDDSLLQSTYAAPVEVVRLDKRGPADLRVLFTIRDLLKAHQVDLLHTHTSTADTWGRLAARMARTPVVVCHSHRNTPISATWLVLNRLLAPATDHFIAIGEGNRRYLIDYEKVAPHRISLVRNVVDYARFQGAVDGRRIRSELGLLDDDWVVTLIGRLTPQKGQAHFLEASRIVAEALPATTFLLVGTGEDEASLRALARSLHLEGRVRFLGARPDVPEILAATDVLVMSSLFEGLPLILLEAMAAGKAIASTDIPGCREMLQEGHAGLLTPPSDPRAQAEAILQLLRDEALRRQLGERAREWVVREHRLESMLVHVDEIYRSLLERPRN